MDTKKITEIQTTSSVGDVTYAIVTQPNAGTETVYRTNLKSAINSLSNIKTVTNIVTSNGYFTVTYSDSTTKRWDYTLDSDGKITAITEHSESNVKQAKRR